MLSEKQHIDDFFRKKEEAFAPDNHLIDAHWQQMRTLLHEPGTEPEKRIPGSKHITKLLGLFVVGIVVLLLAINPFRHSKKKIAATTKQQTTVAAPETKPGKQAVAAMDPLPVTETTAAPQQDVSAPPRVTTAASLPIEQFIPPVANEPTAPIVKLNSEAVNPKPTTYELLQQFYKQLEKEEQVFYINPNRDTTLIAKEGTRLFVPANTLLTKARPAKGQVKIILREFYRYEDIIAAKLATTSNGQQLVTGGMLHISAQQDGKPVTVAPQKAITVHMPTNNYDNRMQLFTGQEVPGSTENSSTLDWLPVGLFQQWTGGHGRTPKALNLNDVEPFSVSYGKKTIAKFYLSQEVLTPKAAIIAQLKQRFGSYYDVIKLKRARKNKDYGQRAGNPLVIDSTPISVKNALASKKLTTQDTLPKYDLRKTDSFYLEQQTRLRNTYNFSLINFGWYNCDRFSNDPRPKVNCMVNLPQGATVGNHVSLLVFTRYRSVIQGNYYGGQQIQYYNVPEGEPVLLITVAVTTDKVVSNIQAFTTSNTVVGNLVFEPTTPEQFKQKLQSLFASQQQ
jgi:hypothetical protein